MLRAIEPDEPVPPIAYRVPWHIDRRDPQHPVVTNAGAEAADFVRVFIEAPVLPPETLLWGLMPPGDGATVCLCDLDLDAACVTVSWFRPRDGREYVWRFVV